MERYLKIPEAAEYLGITTQAVYKQMRRHVIKYKIVDGVKYTTPEWLDDYESKRHSKSDHGTYNGRPVFNKDKGQYSVQMCADACGVKRHIILHKLRTGEILHIRKGHYYVIPEDQVIKMQEKLINEKTG